MLGDGRQLAQERHRSRPRASARQSPGRSASPPSSARTPGSCSRPGGDEVAQERRSSRGRRRRADTRASGAGSAARSRRAAWSCRSPASARTRTTRSWILAREPIEQAVPRQRLVAQRRTLDLRGLDRVPVHSVAERLHVRQRGRRADPGRRRPAATIRSPGVARGGSGGANDTDGSTDVSTVASGAGHGRHGGRAALIRRLALRRRRSARSRAQPSYSKPILTSTRYSTISPSSTTAVDFTTSTSGCCDGLRCGRDGLAGGVAPRLRARADHLADDDDAHGCLLRRSTRSAMMTRGRPVAGPASWLLRGVRRRRTSG